MYNRFEMMSQDHADVSIRIDDTTRSVTPGQVSALLLSIGGLSADEQCFLVEVLRAYRAHRIVVEDHSAPPVHSGEPGRVPSHGISMADNPDVTLKVEGEMDEEEGVDDST
jgi:hypothetical protein